MPRREWTHRLEDILNALERITTYVRGKDLSDFVTSTSTLDAVLYNLVVIGEAASHIPDDIVARHPEIEWRQIRGMRNRLVHEYFGADPAIVWSTIMQDLPDLESKLRRILGDER